MQIQIRNLKGGVPMAFATCYYNREEPPFDLVVFELQPCWTSMGCVHRIYFGQPRKLTEQCYSLDLLSRRIGIAFVMECDSDGTLGRPRQEGGLWNSHNLTRPDHLWDHHCSSGSAWHLARRG